MFVDFVTGRCARKEDNSGTIILNIILNFIVMLYSIIQILLDQGSKLAAHRMIILGPHLRIEMKIF